MNSAHATILLEDQILEELNPISEDNQTEKSSINRTATSNAVVSKGRTKLEISLSKLSELVANIAEAYSAVIFVADPKNKVLHPLAFHSLSREFISEIQIPFGHGLVGWTAENKVRIAVCPFDKDARTLLYYSADQSLKSFIAVPILSKQGDLIGVISCDSKKNYAFPKITEKVLVDCAVQAEILIDLHTANEELSRNTPRKNTEPLINIFNASLSEAKVEYNLFDKVLQLPQELVTRDAISCFINTHEGFGDAKFYSAAKDKRSEQHLVDLICKHKKIRSQNKDVHVLPSEEIRSRSFLAVPFSAFGAEAGTLNVLSAPFSAFSPEDISNLERIAKQIGTELEYLRLKELSKVRQVGPSMLPWRHFIGRILENNKNSTFTTPSLLRIQLEDLHGLEVNIGVQATTELLDQMLRYAQQLTGSGLQVSAPYGTTIYVYGEENPVSMVGKRISNLLSKIDNTTLQSAKASSLKITESILGRLKIDIASCSNLKANGIQSEEAIILSRLAPLNHTHKVEIHKQEVHKLETAQEITQDKETTKTEELVTTSNTITPNTVKPKITIKGPDEYRRSPSVKLTENNFTLGARKKNEELRDKFWK